MNRKQDRPEDAAEFRRRAEERLTSRISKDVAPPDDVELVRLVHELQVHQIELEMQNEELRQSRAELEETLAQYTDIYDFAPTGYLTLSRDGAIRTVNLTGARMLGLDRSLLINRRFGLFVVEEDRPAFQEFLEQVFTSRKTEVCEVSLLREGALQFHLRIEAVGSDDGLECRAVVIDITDRVISATLLLEAKERLQMAISAGKVGLWDWDLRTNRVAYSIEWKRQIGYEDDEISDDYEEWQSRLHPEDRDGALARVNAYLAGGTIDYESEFRLRHKDGSYRNILARASEVRDHDGVRIRLVGSHVDITEYIELRAELLEARKLESVGRLAGGVAHDFNNLLTVISGFAELTSAKMSDADPLRDNLRQITRAADRAAGLTRQLLAFSRRQIMKLEVLNLTAAIAEMEVMLRRLLGANIELVILGATDSVNVRADAGLIEQVVMNLAVNALDAMPGGGRLTIETRGINLDAAFAEDYPLVEPGPYVLLSVSDTGTGMDEATRERVFEPFFTTKSQGKGTGLGLSTVYGIVKQSSGSISISTEPGAGTTISIYLPRVDIDIDGAKPAAVVAITPGAETILLVEDEEGVRYLAGRILELAGYTVLTAVNGTEARLMLEGRDDDVHLLLTDVVMPGISGWELGAQLKKLRPGLKIIYMSGYTGDIVLPHNCLDNSARFLGKPYSASQLTQMVRQVLDGSD